MPEPYRRVRAGLYRSGRYGVIRTSWPGEGPRGGHRWWWEHCTFDDEGTVTIDSALGYRTRAEAIDAARHESDDQ